MTPRQAEMLQAVAKFWKEHGYSPSHAELEKLTGQQNPSVRRLLKQLEERGCILQQPKLRRSIRVLWQPNELKTEEKEREAARTAA